MEKKLAVYELFRNMIAVEILLFLRTEEEVNQYGLAMYIGRTPCQTFKVLKLLEEIGLIERRKKGRERRVYLTDAGKIVAEYLFEIENTLRQLKRRNKVIGGEGQ